MENASKALIIAGAILLSILIISLGILVFGQAKNTIGGANLNQQEIAAFNSQWDTYVGQRKTASEVKNMVQAMIVSNAAESKNGTNRWVALSNDGTPETATLTEKPTLTVPTPANSGTYTITAGYSDDGLIVCLDWK